MLTSYRRSGGGEPAFDEILSIEPDGSFRMERRVSEGRLGEFAGSLEPSQLDALSTALAAVDEPVVIDPTRPRVILEQVDWAGGSSFFPLEEKDLPSQWGDLRRLLRTLLEDLKQLPTAALELSLDESATTATFAVLGDDPVPADLAGAVLAMSLFDENEEYVDSATVAVPADTPPSPLPPGWKLDVPLHHGLPFDPSKILQVTVDLLLGGDPAQLFYTAGKGWY
jgi:hypothetical protein